MAPVAARGTPRAERPGPFRDVHELKEFEQAREAFRVAHADSRSRLAADCWIDFIDCDVARRQARERKQAKPEDEKQGSILQL